MIDSAIGYYQGRETTKMNTLQMETRSPSFSQHIGFVFEKYNAQQQVVFVTKTTSTTCYSTSSIIYIL